MFYDCLQCNECGKIYKLANTPKYCNKCGNQLKSIPFLKGEANSTMVVAKKHFSVGKKEK